MSEEHGHADPPDNAWITTGLFVVIAVSFVAGMLSASGYFGAAHPESAHEGAAERGEPQRGAAHAGETAAPEHGAAHSQEKAPEHTQEPAP